MIDTLVYSTDPCAGIRTLIEKNGGSKEESLRRLFAPPCSYISAREMSVAFAECFEMTEAEFMIQFRALR